MPCMEAMPERILNCQVFLASPSVFLNEVVVHRLLRQSWASAQGLSSHSLFATEEAYSGEQSTASEFLM